MVGRNDYVCTGCDRLVESYGQPVARCDCGGDWRLVFTEKPQMIIVHASTVAHVIAKNKQKMQEVYEEDSAVNSQAMRDLADISYKSARDE